MDDTLTRDRTTWQKLLDQLSRGRSGELVTIEILDEDLGDQTEAVRLPLASASYDARGDVMVVALGGRTPGHPVVVRHFIHHPTKIDVLERPGGAIVLRVVDRGQVQTLISIRPEQAAAPDG